MAKSILWEVAEFFLSGFWVFDFLTKTSWNGQYKPKTTASIGGNYRPRASSFAPRSTGSTNNSIQQKKKKKNELNAFTLEGLKIMNANAVKIRANYSWLKSWYKPKKKIDFSWLK